jgi:hypothetical protein
MQVINNLHGIDETIHDTMRWTADIGMFTIDRSREASCIHKTDFCDDTCFNNKLEVAFAHAIEPKDVRNDEAWENIPSTKIEGIFDRKRNQTSRARLMSRGEAFADFTDIQRVQHLANSTPDTKWWIPTRAWRDKTLWDDVERLEAITPNLVILASLDPSNTQDEWEQLKDADRSIMFYGDDEMTTAPTGERMFMCPKTHQGLKGHCDICKAGCFNKDKRVLVHLAEH